MNRGYVKVWRKMFDAGWLKNHELSVFWIYCLLKASHKEFVAIVGCQRVSLLPGQFIFGRRKAAEETGLTEREIRTCLALLIKWQNVTIKTTNRFSIISIINWNIYQGTEVENDQLTDQQTTSKRPHTNTETHKKETPCDFSSEISVFKNRYPDQEIINQAFQAISSTRKSNCIADRVTLSILKSWDRYPVESVMAGIHRYLEKGYADQGKRESYLLGIIRNNNDTGKSPSGTQATGIDLSQRVRPSTNDRVLDDYYRTQGWEIRT